MTDEKVPTPLKVDIQSLKCQETNSCPPQEADERSKEPPDRYRVVCVTMYLFGITSLLPWNFFIQANDYWMYKFRNTTAEDGSKDLTELQATFSSYLAIASKVPYVLFLLVNAALSSRFEPVKRIQWPMLVMILLFILTTIMVPINTDHNQQTFFTATICTVIAINVMCGFIQGGGTGIAGSLPKRFMGYTVNGMALGGVLASSAQILSLVGDSSPTSSACMYFLCATVIICLTFVYFLLTVRTDLYKFYMSKQARPHKDGKIVTNRRRISSFEVFKKLWVFAFSITLLFWVSLSVLPAVVVLVKSSSTETTIWTGRLFIPVACFLLFNVSDLSGRLVALLITIPAKYKTVTLALTLSRVVFVPLVMLCNASPRSHLPVLFPSDLAFILITLFFGLTNGYLCTVILTQGPKAVEEEHQEAAGSQMAFFLGLGLMLGSVTSYGTVKLL